MTKTPTSFAAARTNPASLARSARAKALPIVLAGGLLLFGVRGVAAAEESVPNNQFTVGGQTITAEGSYAAKMIGGSLDFMATTGPAELQVSATQVLDLVPGDEVLLSALNDGAINSMTVEVVKGQAVIVQVTRKIDDDSGALVLTPTGDETVITPTTSYSFSIGADTVATDSSSEMTPFEVSPPLDDGSGGE